MRSDLRWLGYHLDYFPPDPARAPDARSRRLARQRAKAFATDPAQGDAVILPVVEARDGKTFLFLDVRGRAFGIPYCRATAGDADLARVPVRGFLGRDALPEEAAEARAMRDLMTRAAARHGRAGPASPTGRRGGAGRGTPADGSSSAPTAASQSDGAPTRPFALGAYQQTLLSEGLTSLMTGGGIGATGMAAAAGLQLVGGLARDLLARVLPGKKLDDNSSSSDYLQAQVVDRLQAELQSQLVGVVGAQVGQGSGPGLLKRLQNMFVGESSTATEPMAGSGHPDDAGNSVVADPGTQVTVEGVPVATMGHGMDFLAPAMKLITDGSQTVLCAGRFVARRSAATGVPSTIMAGATSVLVGGPGFSAAAAQIMTDALDAGVPPEAALAATKQAQRAYEAAKAQGASDEQATLDAEAAARTTRLDQASALLIVNALYGEEGGDGRDPDARGVVVVMGADGKRYLHVTGEGRGGDAVTMQVGDYLVNDATGETFEVMQVSIGPMGYKATVLESATTGQAYLVFNGTDQTIDWVTNVAQALGLIPPQYSRAAAEARAFAARYPGGQILGHSLGGGLASYASALTGLPAQVFNPAGLGDGAIRDVYDHGVTTTLSDIEVVIVDGETLDLAQGIGVGPPVFGNVTRYPGPSLSGSARGNPLAVLAHANELHRTPYVIDATNRYPPREFERTPLRPPRH